MRKTLLSLITLIMIISCLFIANFVYADEINATYYEATQDITCYVKNGDVYSPVLIIPKTYYFELTENKNESYYSVLYNGQTFYCTHEAIDTYKKKTDLTNITTPYYYLPIQDRNQETNIFNQETYEKTGTQILKEVKFIGYYCHEDVYYFYISAKTPGNDTVNNYFVKAEEYSLNFSAKNVNLHPNSSELRKHEAEQQTKVAQNKLKRNIFTVVICFLCLVVVCLIYNPFKKKTLSQNHAATYTSEDDF